MKQQYLDPLFQMAEQLAKEFALFPNPDFRGRQQLSGTVSDEVVRQHVQQLRGLAPDAYIEACVTPAEAKSRAGSRAVLKQTRIPLREQIDMGPLYVAEGTLTIAGQPRKVGFICQERTRNNGVWMPEHHLKAVEAARDFAFYGIPVVSLIDTPGADAGEVANLNNQAHAISRLIAEMMMMPVPTVGVVLGNGYSGGAIPLAAGNILLSVRDGVYNTIQPPGLASIARKYDLSWQECAKYVGVSAYELYEQGHVDAIIDYVPGEREPKLDNLIDAISSAIAAIERRTAEFVAATPAVHDHYRRCTDRFLKPSQVLEQMQDIAALSLPSCPTNQSNVFGLAYRYLRYLGLRRRISSTTIDRYGRLSSREIPKGDLPARLAKQRQAAFDQWRNRPLEIRYDDAVKRAWSHFVDAREQLGQKRGAIAQFLLGSREYQYQSALRELMLVCGFHLYNLWKGHAHHNFLVLIDLLADETLEPDNRPALTILDILLDEDVRGPALRECRNLLVFDIIYDQLISEQVAVAGEAREENVISRGSVQRLINTAMERGISELAAKQAGCGEDELRGLFEEWLRRFAGYHQRGDLLKAIGVWKGKMFPRVSEPLFAIITFFFEHLLPNYYRSGRPGKLYDGRILPKNIGVKDFWHRLDIAYRDLLLNEILNDVKRRCRVAPKDLLDRFFTGAQELNANMMTADPVAFPGFRLSIEKALDKGITPCGLYTALATVKGGDQQVGVAISNLPFQAGAWDMASGEKFSKLLVECAIRGLPVICFISSGGMQTKEGAGALFSMPIANDRITRFVRDTQLPVIMFGFGDCTGGAQASMVTHPLVQTYYWSGCNMPFAGQIVVPSHLPMTATLSNYLSEVPGAMQGLVRHPLAEDLDDRLRSVDAKIPVGEETVEAVIARVLEGQLGKDRPVEDPRTVREAALRKPIERALIHARGCTAVKLVRVAKTKGIPVVLVQSDADMDSVAAEMLTEQDHLVCLGGNTPDESYLNARSVIRVAEREKADALHPGIGFLSENADFASLCRNHRINFVGPTSHSMELMGNKSNAIKTALRLKVPVVPGSHGIITSVAAAAELAESIGYPIIIKAVHGGGGKGIQVVESAERLRPLFLQIGAEARSAFGNSDCYIEKYITSFRHVEVQILRDSHGHTHVLGLRDCSVQRNNQKIIEESGATMLRDELREQAYRYAAAIAEEIDYVGAGTVEFIHDLKDDAVYFMEMNTRLQVEHPVTEAVTGIDIVGWQFDIAGGADAAELEFDTTGYAMEVRINAEKAGLDADGSLQFIPDPGTVSACDFPDDPDIDAIVTIGSGKTISPFYDNLVAQVICHGKDREDTIGKLQAYLGKVTVRGVCTNIPLLLAVLGDQLFRDGEYDTTYLKQFFGRADLDQIIRDTEAGAGAAGRKLGLEAITIEDSDEVKVLAPSDGVFYSKPNPDEPEFVEEGAIISVEDTLCLIEAMKLFRAISLSIFNQEEAVLYPPESRYEIVRTNQAGGQMVNKGDLLFVIRPVR